MHPTMVTQGRPCVGSTRDPTPSRRRRRPDRRVQPAVRRPMSLTCAVVDGPDAHDATATLEHFPGLRLVDRNTGDAVPGVVDARSAPRSPPRWRRDRSAEVARRCPGRCVDGPDIRKPRVPAPRVPAPRAPAPRPADRGPVLAAPPSGSPCRGRCPRPPRGRPIPGAPRSTTARFPQPPSGPRAAPSCYPRTRPLVTQCSRDVTSGRFVAHNRTGRVDTPADRVSRHRDGIRPDRRRRNVQWGTQESGTR